MADCAQVEKGVLDGTARVLRELLASPRFRQSMRVLLRELDPENAPKLAEALMEEDPELFLSLISSSPAFVNAGLGFLLPILHKVAGFPPALLREFLAEIADRIQAQRLGEVAGLLLIILSRGIETRDDRLSESMRSLRARAADGLSRSFQDQGADGAGLARGLVDAAIMGAGRMASRLGEEAAREGSATATCLEGLSQGIRRIAEQNPEFMDRVARPLIEAWSDALAVARKGGAGAAGGEDE